MKKHALIGISSFNTKFDEKYIYSLMRWAFHNFDLVDILHPRETAKYLLVSTGTKIGIAKKKSRNEFNRINKIVDKIVNSFENSIRLKLYSGRMLSIDEFKQNKVYNQLIELSQKILKENNDFTKICKKSSITAMEKRLLLKFKLIDKSFFNTYNIDTAIQYIIKELPFIIDFCSIIKLKDTETTICYHKNWEVFDYLFDNKEKFNLKTNFKKIIFD